MIPIAATDSHAISRVINTLCEYIGTGQSPFCLEPRLSEQLLERNMREQV